MADRPILFRDDMVRAILDGRKTVTRRVGPTWARVQPGTKLWVREAHAIGGLVAPTGEAAYRADASDGVRSLVRWRPSIHMPRWACRLEIEVVSVTVTPPAMGQHGWRMADVDDEEARREGFADRDRFLVAWSGLHGGDLTKALTSPVYRIEFRRVT